MPRPRRVQQAGYLHHVISRGNDRKNLFLSVEDFEAYLKLCAIARKQYPVYIYNFVLMPNHIHLLLEPKEDGALSKFMGVVSKGYAQYFNKKYDHMGHVFQERFKSFLVQTERYFFACMRHIDFNPMEMKCIHDPREYAWSGYAELAYGKAKGLALDKHDLYRSLGKNHRERQVAYRAFVLSFQHDNLDLMNKRAGILGDKEFKQKFK